MPKNIAGGTINCTLRVGNSSNAVGVLKATLIYTYEYPLTQNNTFDTATKNALIDFQTRFSLGVDGIYGPETRDNLCWKPIEVDGGCYFRVPQ